MAEDVQQTGGDAPLHPPPKPDGPSRIATLRAQMERTTSEDIREEGRELREAAEQSLNVILDLNLDGNIRWVSPTWPDIVGTDADQVIDKPVADILVQDKSIFVDAVEALRRDDSSSKVIRFPVLPGPKSRLRSRRPSLASPDSDSQDNDAESTEYINLEAQGIMVYDRATGKESHTMWMIRPATLREVTIDLPDVLVESLGVGAEMLAQHLTVLADVGANDPETRPTAVPVLCRICERQITPWWFPKHTELCLQEHRAEAELEMAQENLTEHRNHIVKVLDALEAQDRHKRHSAADAIPTPPPQADYKGMPVGTSSGPSSASSPSVVSRSSSLSGSRERSGTVRHHNRQRSFTVRRPLSRIVELVLDLCDTALEINTPALKDTRNTDTGEFRTQSPQSEGRISQVLQWQSPSAGALENEPGLSLLCDDTTNLSKAKVDAVMRFRQILEYSERIRNEFTSLVQECIDAALAKASRIAAGESGSDSSDESTSRGQVTDEDDAGAENTVKPSVQGPLPIQIPSRSPSAMAMALRSATGSRSTSTSPRRRVTSGLSDRSTSPKGCPTPRSNTGGSGPAVPEPKSWFTDTDPGGESDSSIHSSVQSSSRRAESPASELMLSRATSSRDRKRTSLVLPRAMSASRAHSPARPSGQPLSPLRVLKPRLASNNHDIAIKSPLMSPTLSSSEFHSPTLPAQELHYPQHRRQSSTASSERSRPAVSPHLAMSNAPQPRAAPPSIKDFEIIKPISKGAFGSVYLSKKKSTGDYYAIKALKKADMVAKNQVANVKAERAIMMWQGQSDFVAKLYWTFPSKDYIFLVMEYLNGGDCASLIRVLGTLSEDWAKKYLAEVVLGVEHLHSREIVHRDLKPDNLLIDQKGHLKLTDFGLSRMGLIGRQKRALSGKADHVAPDPLKQGPFSRSTSMASSRSASFDVHGAPSPGNTPNLMPAYSESGIPSYFSLTRDSSATREPTRQNSGQYSDFSESDNFQSAFRRLSLYDEPWQPSGHSPQAEELHREDGDGAGFSLSKATSNAAGHRHSTPPQPGIMPPPAMALFDPDDSNRRFVGTPDYLAPETINGLGQDEMSDWWSIGCILFEFVFGYPPFHADTPDQVFENILARKIDWPSDDMGVSAEAKDLMNKLMCLDPEERLGSNKDEKYSNGGEEIRNHPWFADIDWGTINEAEASFVPAPENPEDTEYFDTRGATAHDFTAEFEDQTTSPTMTPGTEYPDRPHDALSRVRNQVNSMKRGLMPLHIPKHVRDGRSRRLSEPAGGDDFGQFSFKNLPVLEKANKDVIQKLRAEAMQAQARPVPPPKSATSTAPPPMLEGSPILTMPLGRRLSISNRVGSPSGHSFANSSPSRGSQPSSPLVQFSAGGNHERRKTSSGSSQSAASSLQPGSFFDMPRFNSSTKPGSALASPVKAPKSPGPGPLDLDSSALTQVAMPSASPRTRSQTVGSRDGEGREKVSHHQKHRSQVLEVSPSSSDNDESRQKALLRVQRRRQSSRRLSQISLGEGPIFRPLDILVCEDHPVSRLVMEKLLEKLRCRTIIVPDGAEAMRYAMGPVKFDIIMMEFKLPQINGADVARMIRETKNTNCHTPIVAVTGYLKELQAPHHFDALIEKPATMSKLTEILSKQCQWKPSPPGWAPPPLPITPAAFPPSSLRNESVHADESPTSTSSGFGAVQSTNSYRNSSREDSMSSVSVFTEPDVRSEDGQSANAKFLAHQDASIGGGMPANPSLLGPRGAMHAMAALKHQDSAPAGIDAKEVRKQPSAELIEAKRKALGRERAGGGDLGDDEDEELGNIRAGSKSPRNRSGFLIPNKEASAEMLRSTSQNSVISVVPRSGTSESQLALSPPSGHSGVIEQARPSATTPPIIFPLHPGHESKEIEMDVKPDTVDSEATSTSPAEPRLTH